MRPRPNSTSTRSGAPEATSVAVADFTPIDTTLPSWGTWGTGPARARYTLLPETASPVGTISSNAITSLISPSSVLNALTIPDRLMLAVWRTSGTAPDLRLTNFRGQVVDRLMASSWSPDVTNGSRWVPRAQKLVLASKRELAAISFDILSIGVKASSIEPGIDTFFSGLPLHNGLFDVSRDGEQLIYSAGPVETSLSSIEIDRTRPTPLVATQVLSSTTMLRGRISPTGDRIFLARDALGAAPTRRGFLLFNVLEEPSRRSRAQWRISWTFNGLRMAPRSCICRESGATKSG